LGCSSQAYDLTYTHTHTHTFDEGNMKKKKKIQEFRMIKELKEMIGKRRSFINHLKKNFTIQPPYIDGCFIL
jgi:hypothetical protein